ncbi:MAG: hypothetical protein EBW87_03475 [Burkholderiaceae bacterium]|jgi:hypothetical protein|nr:hypothetical protein [Burkholderiaceae bacterium]
MDTAQVKKQKYLSVDETAKQLSVSKAHLANMRSLKTGPKWMTKNGEIVYLADTVGLYVSKQKSISFWANLEPIKLNWKAPQIQK